MLQGVTVTVMIVIDSQPPPLPYPFINPERSYFKDDMDHNSSVRKCVSYNVSLNY